MAGKDGAAWFSRFSRASGWKSRAFRGANPSLFYQRDAAMHKRRGQNDPRRAGIAPRGAVFCGFLTRRSTAKTPAAYSPGAANHSSLGMLVALCRYHGKK
jgi:hypothetical protein